MTTIEIANANEIKADWLEVYPVNHEDIKGSFERKHGKRPEVAYRLGVMVFVVVDSENEN